MSQSGDAGTKPNRGRSRMTVYRRTLESLEDETSIEPLNRVLGALRAAIEACEQRVEAVASDASDDHREAVIDEECDMTENLLGATFVTCQVFIAGTVAQVMRLHGFAKEDGVTLGCCSGKKPQCSAVLPCM